MNNYKLSNIIKKDLKKRGFKESEIQKKNMNLRYIKNLLDKYITQEFTEHYFDITEDRSNWIDVEAINYGWIWCDRTNKDTDIIIKRMFVSHCKEFNKICPDRKIFIAENSKYIWIVLPMRDVSRVKEDVCMILNKKEDILNGTGLIN